MKNLKNKIGNLSRGFRGLYNSRFEKFEDLPLNESRLVIGETIEEREIAAYKFGRAGKIKILLLAGVHGNDLAAIKLMHKMVNYLNARKQPILGVEIFVIPCLNLDGMAAAISEPNYFSGKNIGRFNANGVDLNQNFDVESFESEHDVYCGENPFSEPESLLLSNFIKEQKINVLYSFGDGKQAVSGNQNNLSSILVKDFVKNSSYRYLDGESWEIIQQTGTIREWCDLNKIAYVEVECATRWGSDWKNLKTAIISGLKYHYG